MVRGEIVCLDLEATGLDIENDDIIEVAAVRFNEDKITAELQTLIDPGIPIPSRITSLTGISDDDVTGKPSIQDIYAELEDFIGDAPILGHKVNYDVSLLRAHGLALHNELIDTYELAAFLMPTAVRYSLSSLVEQLELSNLNAHRALDDVHATVELYQVLWKKLLELPFSLLSEIANASTDLEWDAKPAIVDALRVRAKEAFDKTKATPPPAFRPFQKNEQRDSIYLPPNTEPIDIKSVSSLIEANGRMSEYMPNYEPRPSQVRMLKRVTEALNNNTHLMIEAPTGTGKSLAYLIPAIYWSTYNESRVVVSTATLALQDQLMEQDLPLLKEALGVNFEAAVAKGRSNYLCPRQLEAQRRRHPRSVDELRVMAKVLVWLQGSLSGDKAEINLRGFAEDMAWLKLSAQDEGCNLHRCDKQMNGACPFFKARRKAESAHIVVANHALLLSDVQKGSRVLPEYSHVIIDEGHHLEDATTRGLQVRLDQSTIKRRFSDLGSTSSGMFGELLSNLKRTVAEDVYEKVEKAVSTTADHIKTIDEGVGGLFRNITKFLDMSGQLQENGYSTAIRILPSTRNAPEWAEVNEAWTKLDSSLNRFSSSIVTLLTLLNQIALKNQEFEGSGDYLITLQSTENDIAELQEQLESFVTTPQHNEIYWCAVSANNNYVSLNIAPLHVGLLIKEHLWSKKDSVILTSATIRTAKSFSYVRERLSAEPDIVDEFTVPSPFDYKNSTLIFIPTDIPEPNDRYKYQTMLERGIIEVASVTNGRLLGLFTSYVQLQQTAQNIGPRLALGGIDVLDQASGSSRRLLVESFKSLDKAVLLGTRSFWEGIDLPGDDLQVLAIARLPFSVPSDPIFAARSESFQNSFIQYSVPDAILRFRQGFGRLIRRSTDRGVVAIFDKRVISKRYGRHFLESLPQCTVMRAPLAKLPDATRQWLDRA